MCSTMNLLYIHFFIFDRGLWRSAVIMAKVFQFVGIQLVLLRHNLMDYRTMDYTQVEYWYCII